MKRTSLPVICSVVMILVCLGGGEARAQGARPCVGAITNACLPATLTGMGYEPKALSSGFLIKIERDDWTMYVQLVLSSDNSKLGFNANLGDVTEASVSADQWKDVLAANHDVDPSTFTYNRDTKKLYLHRVLDNRGLTAVVLRDQLEKYLTDLRSTEKVWSAVAH